MKNQNPSYFIKISYIAHANPSNMWCDFIFLQTFFAIRITCTGTSKGYFDCCSVILKINVEGKKLTNLYRGRENEVKYVLIDIEGALKTRTACKSAF